MAPSDNKPLDGGISAFFRDEAPADIVRAIESGEKGKILEPTYPYAERWAKDDYEDAIEALQIQLVQMQSWVKETGQRVAVIFEGRDAAGKGGTIKRFRENLNPRGARTVALSKPTETEAGEWYFQRYIQHLPTAGEIVFFDRSWYNRGVVEHVFDFCTPEQRKKWFAQVNDFEKLITGDGIKLFKIWLNVGRATQLRRFLDREQDPLKHWKLSWIDVAGLSKWDEYTSAIDETLTRTHTDHAPWTVVRSDDKKRARVNTIRAVLQHLNYPNRDLGEIDTKIVGDPSIWHA